MLEAGQRSANGRDAIKVHGDCPMKHATRFALAATFAVLAWTAWRPRVPEPRRDHHRSVSRPEAPPTSWHACWRRNSRRSSDRISSSRTSAAGGTTIATGRVSRATPDGHTLLLHNLQISANVALYPKLKLRHREGPRPRRVRQPQSIGAGRPKITRAEHARGASCIDEDDPH